MSESPRRRISFFEDVGFTNAVDALTTEIRRLYFADETPWVIGYSGGKDSTAVTQLVWMALSECESDARPTKPVYVITTDTLVENPIVAAWVRGSLDALQEAAGAQDLPFKAQLLEPKTEDSFWVNLIGKGYPAPRPGFRWCTERLKIKPASRFIEDTANRYGEAILLIGARSAESAVRAASLNRRESVTREGLTAHPDLVNTLVYAPIQSWTNDDVWTFLMRSPNPWGQSNKDLMALYRGATEDNECPVVVDTSTPSCGNSRFGCWVCTLVDQDKSMKAMIQNDVEKSWMSPLLELRNELDFRGDDQRRKDRERRDFRRLSGRPQLNRTGDNLVPGPYTQSARATWLERLLHVQTVIRTNPDAPAIFRDIQLVSPQELRAIRRIWIEDKHEIEDLLPKLFEKATGTKYFDLGEESPVLDAEALSLLDSAAKGDRIQYETLRNMLHIEHTHRSGAALIAKRGLFQELETAIENGFFADANDATAWAKQRMAIEESPSPAYGDDAEGPDVVQELIREESGPVIATRSDMGVDRAI